MTDAHHVYDMNRVEDPLPEYEFCIIGSGPAGMVLAAELVGGGRQVCVLESGRLAPSAHADALREVVTTDLAIKPYSRERVLGGASSTWSGLAPPLDPVDFAERHLPVPGWPLAYEELVPYWQKASDRYFFPPWESFAPADWVKGIRESGDLRPVWTEMTEKIFLALSSPKNFGVELKGIFATPGAALYYDATVVRLHAEQSGEERTATVRSAEVVTSSGKRRRVTARCFILAAGGIENARLLLVSTGADGVGLGNGYDQVGRCFMNHPKNKYGTVRLRRPLRDAPYFLGFMKHGYSGYCGLRLPEERQRELGVLNSYLRLEPVYPWTDRTGVEVAIVLIKKWHTFFEWWKDRQKNRLTALRSYAETGDDSATQNEQKSWWQWLLLGGAMVRDCWPVSLYLRARLLKRRPEIRQFRLRYFMEMEPRPENRVTLSDRVDRHGVPLPVVSCSVSELDRRSLLEVHRAFVAEVARQNLGELSSDLETADPWPIDQDASHHIGTTRMGHDPATSVVNVNLRVHGVENLYAAGSSVFATSGCANPTYTICALSIRLAEHLARLSAREVRHV